MRSPRYLDPRCRVRRLAGVNAFPVELADELKRQGAYVVAFASRPHMDSAPARSFAKLGELADAVLDTGIPPGDAVVPTSSGTTAALSTLCSTYLWNLLLVRLTALAGDVSLPLWQSSNLPGGDTANERHLGRYRDRVPMLWKIFPGRVESRAGRSWRR